MEEANGVKILFRFYSDVLEQQTVETLWAVAVNESMGYYQIDSIPFYIPFIATDDIVCAQYDETEEMLTYRETIEPSGNSTIWVVITDDATDINEVRTIFENLECISESLSERYFTMEVKATINYLQVKTH